jgi:hypothetical protein
VLTTACSWRSTRSIAPSVPREAVDVTRYTITVAPPSSNGPLALQATCTVKPWAEPASAGSVLLDAQLALRSAW